MFRRLSLGQANYVASQECQPSLAMGDWESSVATSLKRQNRPYYNLVIYQAAPWPRIPTYALAQSHTTNNSFSRSESRTAYHRSSG